MPTSLVAKCLAKVPSGRFFNVYGTWECLNVTYAELTDRAEDGEKFASIGLPQDCVTVYVLDEHMQVVPLGEAGEIYVDTPMLAVEYLHDPEKTAAQFPTVVVNDEAKKMYRTGDGGRIRSSGELECLGRIDSTVKIRGFKVSIPFVEATIKEHANVTSCAVSDEILHILRRWPRSLPTAGETASHASDVWL